MNIDFDDILVNNQVYWARIKNNSIAIFNKLSTAWDTFNVAIPITTRVNPDNIQTIVKDIMSFS